jgi:hypothetical protein
MPPQVASDAELEKSLIEVYKPLHAMVKVIRDRHGISIAEAIQRFGGPGITREYRKIVRDMNAELGGEG